MEERLLCDYYDGILSKSDFELVSKKRNAEKQSLSHDLELSYYHLAAPTSKKA